MSLQGHPNTVSRDEAEEVMGDTLFEKLVKLFEAEEHRFEDLRFLIGQLRTDLDKLQGRMFVFFGEEPCPTCLGRGRVQKIDATYKDVMGHEPSKEVDKKAECTHPMVYDYKCQHCNYEYPHAKEV